MQVRTRRSESNMRMMKCVVFMVVLTLHQSRARGDAEVSCVFMESCILPCSFQTGEGLVLQWVKVEGNVPVHSFYYGQDQLNVQSQDFRGRTSLFKDQISRGNASLLLTGVKVQDEGRYKCYIGTETLMEESFINLKVDAPVREVDIQQVEDGFTCSSEGIYPEPELTWSTSPQSNETPQNQTRVQQTEQQLYSISSLIASVPDLDYSCTVSTGRNKRSATWFQLTSINGSDTETTIPCTSSSTPPTGLIWRFNHSQIILIRTRTDFTVSEDWSQHVKSGSESDSLTLKDLSSTQEGIYTCELRNAEGTYVRNTFLRIEKSPDSPNKDAVIAAGVVGAIVVLGLIIAAIVIYKMYTRQPQAPSPQQREMSPLEDQISNSHSLLEEEATNDNVTG